MDALTLLLFGRFPREVGNPARKIVYNLFSFSRFVDLNNGFRDVYVCVYDVKLNIDKVFIEIDAPSLEKALESARAMHLKLKALDLPHIITFSGHRGFHFYILFQAWIPPNVETAKAVIKDIQLSLSEGIEYVDRRIFGDVRRLVRVPGTLHPVTRRYCTYVPYDMLFEPAEKIVDWASRHHVIDIQIKKLPDIRELVDVDYIPSYEIVPCERPDFPRHSIPRDIYKFLSGIIRPCVAEVLAADRDPPHEIRTDLVAELYWLGYDEEDIVEIIRRLRWADFDEEITRYHVRKICEKALLPMSCSKLSTFVRCTKCGWNYFWASLAAERERESAPRRTREGARRNSVREGLCAGAEATVKPHKPLPERNSPSRV